MATAFGELLRHWRSARRLSQEQLAFDAQLSTRHLSCLERAKSQPSRDAVLELSAALGLELRDQNALLHAAGFAPVYAASSFDSLDLAPVRRALELLLERAEPHGAIVVDRTWNVLRVNQGATRLIRAFGPAEPDPAIAGNVLKALLHPAGLRPAIVNWESVAAQAMGRLERELALNPTDEARRSLHAELRQYPGIASLPTVHDAPSLGPTATIHFRRGADEVRLFTLLTSLGTPLDVTAQELTIESYFPADEASEAWLRQGASARPT